MNNLFVEIIKSQDNKYYLLMVKNNKLTTQQLNRFIDGLSGYQSFLNKLGKKFNAISHVNDSIIIFKTNKDAINAKEWIESLITIKALYLQ